MAEDNLLNQKIVNYILEKQGAKITVTSNGQEALDNLGHTRYDVVLMDLHMPVLDGYSATRYIRTELKNNIPIIALTASSTADETGECLKAGMNACISKPFDADGLCRLILDLTHHT